MARYLKVENKPLIRDMKSKAILAQDIQERDNYLARRALLSTVETQTKEINTLRQDVELLKEALKQLSTCKQAN